MWDCYPTNELGLRKGFGYVEFDNIDVVPKALLLNKSEQTICINGLSLPPFFIYLKFGCTSAKNIKKFQDKFDGVRFKSFKLRSHLVLFASKDHDIHRLVVFLQSHVLLPVNLEPFFFSNSQITRKPCSHRIHILPLHVFLKFQVENGKLIIDLGIEELWGFLCQIYSSSTKSNNDDEVGEIQRKVFEVKGRTDVVEVIDIDISEIEDLYLSSDSFKSMTNLRYLYITNNVDMVDESDEVYIVHLHEGLEWLSDKLRHFYWDSFPLKSLPSTFCAEWLVQLSMHHSKLKKLWDGVQRLDNLVVISLDDSKDLIEIPNLYTYGKCFYYDIYEHTKKVDNVVQNFVMEGYYFQIMYS
ncbi:hypothetical protein RYX36_015237 [Vicia faba]